MREIHSYSCRAFRVLREKLGSFYSKKVQGIFRKEFGDYGDDDDDVALILSALEVKG